jgi:RNA polymerase sigma factor (sigma-70 family)
MRDGEIVAAVVSGDPGALIAAYDQYGPGLYTYCRSLVSNPVDAADAVQDTFVVAATRLGGLRDPSRLRPWLYAVARNEGRRQLAGPHLSRSVADNDATMISQRIEDSGTRLDQMEQRELVSSALARLDQGDQEVLQLTLRDELYGADLADALGVPRNQAQALAARARTRFETALSTLMTARNGQGTCAELLGILAESTELTGPVRKQVRRHLSSCPGCQERQRQPVNAVLMLSALPAPVLPGGLRYQVLGLLTDSSPEAVAYRAAVAERAGRFTRSGFPAPLDPLPKVRSPATLIPAAGVLVALVALFGGGAVLVADTLHRSPPAITSVAPAASAHAAPAVQTPSPGAPHGHKKSARRHGSGTPGAQGSYATGTANGTAPKKPGHSATPTATKSRHTTKPSSGPSSTPPATQPATPTPTDTATTSPSSGTAAGGSSNGLVGTIIGLLSAV